MAITKASGNSVTAAAKGDLVVGSATNDSSILAVGTNDYVLTAASGEATGLKWAAASSGALTKIAAASFSAASTVDVDSVFSATYDNYVVFLKVYSSVGGADLQLQLRYAGPSTRTASYYGAAVKFNRSGTLTNLGSDNVSQYTLSDVLSGASAENDYFTLQFNSMNTTSGYPIMSGNGMINSGTQAVLLSMTNFATLTAYTGFRLLVSSGNITGNYYVYGVQN